ncbi:MAG: hypothetical protein ABIP49_04805, partial [Lysobacterales bacterium]
GEFSGAARALRFGNTAELAAWYSVSQAGYERALPTAVRKDGIEVVREYTDAEGMALTRVKLGQEIQVHLKIRATRSDGVDDIAIIDLLPGGFEPVQEFRAATTVAADEEEGDGSESDMPPEPAWQSPVGLGISTWQPQYVDVRDDRVVIYGYANASVQEFVYRIKATNVGSFVVPPAYGESMYDRSVQAQSLGGRIDVER